jgi:hypothetical protein
MSTEKAHEWVKGLLAEARQVNHAGCYFDFIPGPDCDCCKGTGYSVMHGAPPKRYGPTLNPYCFSCGRKPDTWLHERVTAKAVQIVLREHPELR